jgi:hypothetical protein
MVQLKEMPGLGKSVEISHIDYSSILMKTVEKFLIRPEPLKHGAISRTTYAYYTA